MSEFFDVRLFTEVFVTLFVIMDPPGTVPVFLGLTSAMGAKQRNQAARTAILVAFGVIVAFAVFGQQILSYMHISLPALQTAGGLLLLLVAMELLSGKMEEPQPSGNEGVIVARVRVGRSRGARRPVGRSGGVGRRGYCRAHGCQPPGARGPGP